MLILLDPDPCDSGETVEDEFEAEPEAREKRSIGGYWERENADESLFLMAETTVNGKDVRSQLTENSAA